MRYIESAALWYAFSLSCILSFSVSLPWFLLYLLVTYLSAMLHTCHSSTSCNPRSATTAHKLSVYCACKKQIRRHTLSVSQVVQTLQLGDPSAAGEEVLYLAQIQYWIQSENNVHVKRRLDPGHVKRYEKINVCISKVRSIRLQTRAL
jgi:hypothetical protein